MTRTACLALVLPILPACYLSHSEGDDDDRVLPTDPPGHEPPVAERPAPDPDVAGSDDGCHSLSVTVSAGETTAVHSWRLPDSFVECLPGHDLAGTAVLRVRAGAEVGCGFRPCAAPWISLEVDPTVGVHADGGVALSYYATIDARYEALGSDACSVEIVRNDGSATEGRFACASMVGGGPGDPPTIALTDGAFCCAPE